MVAEPVQATVQVLNRVINDTSAFINKQSEKLQNSDSLSKIFHHESGLDVPPPPSPPPSHIESLFNRATDNITRNKVAYLSVIGVGLGYAWYHVQNKLQKHSLERVNRRVPKLPNGARTDAVFIFGSFTDHLTRLLAYDLEKRGFTVFCAILDSTDVQYIKSNKVSEEIRFVDFTIQSIENAVSELNDILKTAVVPFSGAEPHFLCLQSIIFAPSWHFPVGPIENTSIGTWKKLTTRISMVMEVLTSGLLHIARNQSSKFILLNSSIGSLDLPYHAPESIFQNTLGHLFTILDRELQQYGMSATQIIVGNLRVSNQKINSVTRVESLVNTETRAWTSEMRDLYGSDFAKIQLKSSTIRGSGGDGTPIKDLFHLIFDVIYAKHSTPVEFCGKGARLKNFLTTLRKQAHSRSSSVTFPDGTVPEEYGLPPIDKATDVDSLQRFEVIRYLEAFNVSHTDKLKEHELRRVLKETLSVSI
ncbi:hypothetical protein KGF57_005392 [Candida theae]|uniref:Mug135-like C-terminal domain-containing protein n=1 Tax=Candida theae TaxID=1198502 RepID=A0AAD5B8T5_9ASCO|nr:uncharacterized protein KGF57_005392 [Candida theae]KAI5948647.1 hypothetical protein KGF57_005392 [Candida theae]